MDKLKHYILHFSGLGLGFHNYQYQISNDFFEAFDNSEIEQASIIVDLSLEKQERMLIFDFEISGNINVMCDRCLDKFDYPLDISEQLIVKFGEAFDQENEEVIILPEHEHQLDLSSYLYDFIILSLPIRIVHPEDENGSSNCNPEIIEKIQKLSEPEPDPRWGSLKDLISDN